MVVDLGGELKTTTFLILKIKERKKKVPNHKIVRMANVTFFLEKRLENIVRAY